MVQFHDDFQNHSVSCIEVGCDTKRLRRQGLELGPCEGNVALARDNLVPVAIIAHKEELRIIKTLFSNRYDDQVLGVVGVQKELDKAATDEIEDCFLTDVPINTCARVRETLRILLKTHFAIIYAYPKGLPFVDTDTQDIEQDIWVFFQWDTKPQYVRPIANESV